MARLRKVVVVIVAVYLALLAGLLAVMRKPALFGQVMSKIPERLMMVVPFKQLWYIARAGRLRVGDGAPDFELRTGDQRSLVQLSRFRGRKPVVLIFGSYT